jgi:mannose-6-phosphate isomerase-like protein (cupin superfamily)
LIFFAPRGADHQTFHHEDEFSFIVRGSGELVMENENVNCRIGDSIFVPALKPHHFENFSEDFAAWAAFF